MEDLIFIEIAIAHLEKLRNEIVTQGKVANFKTIIGNDFVFNAKTSNEISVCSNTVKLFTGLTRSELIKEVNERTEFEINEINDYVELLKSKNKFDFDKELEQIVIISDDPISIIQNEEEKELTEIMDNDFKNHQKLIIKPVVIDNLVLEERLAKLKKEEQRLKKLPKSLRGDLKEVQKSINNIKSWL